MHILLTGSTGLLGSHILKLGLERGMTFTCPVRSIKKRSYLYKIQDQDKIQDQVKIIEMDLVSDDFSIKNRGIDLIINCAALASPFEKDYLSMDKINIEFVKKLYLQAKDNAIKLVHISSIATFCDGTEDYKVDEENPGNIRPTYYGKSKSIIDKWLDHQDQQDEKVSERKKTLIIHPCYILGDYDSRPSSGAIFFALKMKKITKILKRKKNFVAAEDVANGIFQAIEKECHGHYILGGENLKIKDFVEFACLKLKIPNNVVIAEIDELSEIEKEFSSSSEVSWEKAKHAFNYNPKILNEVFIEQSINYFVEQKMLRIKE